MQHRIAQKLGDSFYDYYRYRANVSEFSSWQNSLQALSTQLTYARLRAQGIILEMQLPLASARLDCLLFGKDTEGTDSSVLIELKQWSHAADSDYDDCVLTVVGKGERALAHPSRQALNYAMYLRDTNSAFADKAEALLLQPCSWLHNMAPDSASAVRSAKFESLLAESPLFLGSDADEFAGFLKATVGNGAGLPVMERVISGRYRPSKRLMDHTAQVIRGEPAYVLLDEQIVAYDAVLAMVRRAQRRKIERGVVIVRGGPGTGKSVLALNLMGNLLKLGVVVQHATGSKAFTENLWRAIGARSKPLFRYFNSFGAAERGQIDVLILDESHRIRSSSNARWTAKARRSDRSQVDELVEAARVSVFFIDDYQVVRPGEVGSTTMIREAAVRHDAQTEEIDLRTQFRCAGSDEYISWVDQLLEIRKTGTTQLGRLDRFEFRIVDEPDELDQLIRRRASEGQTARLTAGFCWPWSDPARDGTLVEDVVVNGMRRPWNAKPDATRLAPGLPKAQFWASDPNGLAPIGCIYTAQGFEFDYCGVIIGRDLVYRAEGWVGQPEYSYDRVVKTRAGARFTDCVRNAYRVLLTRGLKGCYVYIQDQETKRFIHSRSI